MTIRSASSGARLAAATDNLAFEAAFEALELAVSYAISAREAAWRGNKQLLDSHLRELRLCTLTAIEARKRLAAPAEGLPHG